MKIVVITRRKQRHQRALIDQAIDALVEHDGTRDRAIERVGELAAEYGALAERTGNGDLTMLVVQIEQVVSQLDGCAT